MKKQPLSYQQQDSSCWVTSMSNGLIYLLGHGGKINNLIARMLYSGTSVHGTEDEIAKDLIAFINSNKIPINCRIVQGQKVTKTIITKNLNDNSVIVADTQSGDHSVLLTKHENGKLHIFDPDWTSVISWKNKNNNNCKIERSRPHTNVIVAIDEFFKQKYYENTLPFKMGAPSERYIVIMKKTKK
jgi:hypothetical protein